MLLMTFSMLKRFRHVHKTCSVVVRHGRDTTHRLEFQEETGPAAPAELRGRPDYSHVALGSSGGMPSAPLKVRAPRSPTNSVSVETAAASVESPPRNLSELCARFARQARALSPEHPAASPARTAQPARSPQPHAAVLGGDDPEFVML